MTFDLVCGECESGFDLDLDDILEDATRIVCPTCHAKAPRRQTDLLVSAIDELLHAIGGLAEHFSVSLAVETDDLSPAYEPQGHKSHRRAQADEDEDEADEEADADEDYAEDGDLDDDG